MEPANEHDPTMDSHLVHAVNVNNKKEVAEMKFLTKSLANARHVQENIHRQEEKDLVRQLWKLHLEKERRHPGHDYARRSGHALHRLSREHIDGAHSQRRGSNSLLYNVDGHHYYPHPPLPSHHQHGHDRAAHATHRGETHDSPTASNHHPYAGNRRVSGHHISSSNTSSHHFDPTLFVHHHRPEYFPVPHHASRRHVTAGYQPPVDIPGVISQSSRLNAVLQPAGYGHSITEHAAHLGMHKHHYGGISHDDHHRPFHAHPPNRATNMHNIDSYDSLTRYITLLDYQANEERKSQKCHRGKSHHRNDKVPNAEKEDKPNNGEVQQEITAVSDGEKADEMSDSAKKGVHEKTVLPDNHIQKTSKAVPKSIGLADIHSSAPPPITKTAASTLTDDQKAAQPSQCGERTQGFSHPMRRQGVEGRASSLDKMTATKPRGSKHKSSKMKDVISAETDALRIKSRKGFTKTKDKPGTRESHGEIPAQHSSNYDRLPRHPSVHHPHHITRQIVSDLQAIATHSSHHGRTYHPHHHAPADHTHHLPERHEAPLTAAERKRLAVELLAREYPVLLRHAPTKFDPMDALMCRYLRLSSTNVETLEEMCREAGIEVGAHAHHQIDNVNEYVFGSKK